MKVIYEPKGRAREYAELAVNLYNGCSHGCEYCYAPAVMHKTKENFFNYPVPRKNVIELLEKDLIEMDNNNDNREVLLCFSCDPYQDIDGEFQLTRQAIKLFIKYNIHYNILTKGGNRISRDLKLIGTKPELCRLGATLVFANDNMCRRYEPGAVVTSNRIFALTCAHRGGLKTWVSLEPVWSYADTYVLILLTHKVVDEYKIGKLNYHAHAKEIDWKAFKDGIVDLCESLGVNYVLKNDLAVL